MPKIRVELDVPDGRFCDGCRVLHKFAKYCALFNIMLDCNASDLANIRDYRTWQCIAAEVKERP